ncbi:alpha/beta hydrolase [Porticoccaceae bacterium]|nr:alpha/beta hydrolase [Porticoccaceae bacterium]MDB2550126.1 alpha/beta hydrolase [Porticoccaceae bacterium]
MGQSRDTFDQSKITALRENLPTFSAETALVDPADTTLGQYLDFYHLPIPRGDLHLRAGVINLHQAEQHQAIVSLCWMPKNPLGSVIVVHGYMDHMGLFNHLIEHLLERRLNVICFDLPGHGLSTGQPGFILDYADYVRALTGVIDISQTMFDLPLQAIGQSMGGAILLKHLINFGRKENYPFARLNLLAPLLRPRGWGVNRLLFRLVRLFSGSSKRVFRPSSFDVEFLDFVKNRDPFQPRRVPMAWVAALDQWIKEFCRFGADDQFTDTQINLIQGSGDKTLAWQDNLTQFKHQLPGLQVQIIAEANHHLVNEIEPLRREIFAALKL